MTLYAISELVDKEQIRFYLSTDINYAAYAIGDLEPPYYDHTRWYSASRTGSIEALGLVYSALQPEVLFLMGEVPALSALLLYGIGSDTVFFTAKPETEGTLRSFYDIEHISYMLRMRVNRGIFKSVENADAPGSAILPIGINQIGEVESLIRDAAEVDGRDIRDVAFAPEMVIDGYYRGMYRTGRLVALAGTHLTAPQSHIAAVGNVVVHPEFRRQGLGGLVSNAVTAALITDNFDLIVLNVRQNNQGALKIYRKLGYKQVGAFIEGVAHRR